MAATTKEEVLSLVWAALQSVPNITTFARNRGLMSSEMRPALVMMDGDLSGGLPAPRSGRGGLLPAARTTKILRPQIFVLPRTILPTNDADGATIADVVSPYEAEITRRVLGSAPLVALLGPNGGVSYSGHETDLKSGAAMSGQIRFDFQITFVFDPAI